MTLVTVIAITVSSVFSGAEDTTEDSATEDTTDQINPGPVLVCRVVGAGGSSAATGVGCASRKRQPASLVCILSGLM